MSVRCLSTVPRTPSSTSLASVPDSLDGDIEKGKPEDVTVTMTTSSDVIAVPTSDVTDENKKKAKEEAQDP